MAKFAFRWLLCGRDEVIRKADDCLMECYSSTILSEYYRDSLPSFPGLQATERLSSNSGITEGNYEWLLADGLGVQDQGCFDTVQHWGEWPGCKKPNGLSQSQCAFRLADKTFVLCMAFNLANKIALPTYRKQAIPSGRQVCRSLKPMANC